MSEKNIMDWCPVPVAKQAQFLKICRRHPLNSGICGWEKEPHQYKLNAVKITRLLTGIKGTRFNKRAVDWIWWSGPPWIRGLALILWSNCIPVVDELSWIWGWMQNPHKHIDVSPIPSNYTHQTHAKRYDEYDELQTKKLVGLVMAAVETQCPDGPGVVRWTHVDANVQQREKRTLPQTQKKHKKQKTAIVEPDLVPGWCGRWNLSASSVMMLMGGQKILDDLCDRINRETQRITGVMAWMSHDDVLDAIKGAVMRGVRVDIVVQDEPFTYFKKYTQIPRQLRQIDGIGAVAIPVVRCAGIQGPGKQRPNIHAKIIVFESLCCVWQGSFNATANGVRSLDQVLVFKTTETDLARMASLLECVHSVSRVIESDR